MQTVMVAALILSGSGVQAGLGMPMEGMSLQEPGMNPACVMNMTNEKLVAMSDNGSGAAPDCQMDADSCHSTCANYQSVNGDTLAFYSGAISFLSTSTILAPIAAQYPIDHPPKPASSL
ncbi:MULTISPECIES: hypothetical protein [unclassified Marinimicrobium]|uniref:hypothetical protein n=2 Tax=Cellvibrionaceae TaxID=1706371 RepID=UPI00257D2675|nr:MULTISPECIES: hypothetical protein [unclassified Marinimicrobium]